MKYNIKDVNHVYAEFANVICKINPKLTIPPISLIVKLLNGDPTVIGHYCNVLNLGEGGLNCIINNINVKYYDTAKILSTTVGLRDQFSKLFDVKIESIGDAFEVYYKGEPILVIDEMNDLMYIDQASLDNYYLCKNVEIVGDFGGVISITESEIPDITSIVKSYLKSFVETNEKDGNFELSIEEPITINGETYILSIFSSYASETHENDPLIDVYVDSVEVSVYSEEGEPMINGNTYKVINEDELKEYVKKIVETTFLK